jgi:hypothetical protein
MNDLAREGAEEDAFACELSDDALERAAGEEQVAAYTQIAFCTMGVCPGG